LFGRAYPTTDWTVQALLDAYHDTKEWQGIFQSTTGLIFFGTPFRGAEGMSQSEMLQAALSEYEQEEVHTEVLPSNVGAIVGKQRRTVSMSLCGLLM
jgi:hypothetical protein